MISLMIGAPQIFLILVVPLAIFFLGYFVGKKAGYIKRVKEIDKRDAVQKSV